MKTHISPLYLIVLFIVAILTACQNSKKNVPQHNQPYSKVSPDFNADSAYTFVEAQVGFGPRVPNTVPHKRCAEYLADKLKEYGAEVSLQNATVTAFDGSQLNITNIIGAYNPHMNDRILLCAHWDTRPFADNDTQDKWHTPILGANDGAGGVAVLLEIARQIQLKAPQVGIDLIFFDAEDYGTPRFEEKEEGDWWCLGSQYWSKNPHAVGYFARYGILLDMVSAQDARFYKEQFSLQNAGNVLANVWSTAHKLGYGDYFVNQQGGAITDDHIPVMQNRAIPTIDIIHFVPNSETGFGKYWHTVEDNLSQVSRETMKAVGQTVMEVIYSEK